MFADPIHLVFFSSLFSLITNCINTVLFVILLDTNCYFVGKCKKNSESRKKRKWNPKNGSVSNARHHVRVGKELDAPIGQIEIF